MTTRAELLDAVREAVRLEVADMRPVVTDPLPCDLDAERLILAAMIEGYPVDPRMTDAHFYAPINAAVFEVASAALALGKRVDRSLILAGVAAQGWTGAGIAGLVDEILLDTPAHRVLTREVATVVRLAARRRAVAALDEARAACVHETDLGALAATLRRVADGLAPRR